MAIAMGASLLCTACEGLAIKATAAALLAEYSQRERLALYVTMDHRSEATRTSFVRLLSSSGHLARDYMAMDLASDEQGGNFGARLVSAYFHIEPSVHPVIFPTALLYKNGELLGRVRLEHVLYQPGRVTVNGAAPGLHTWAELAATNGHVMNVRVSQIPCYQIAEMLFRTFGTMHLVEGPSVAAIDYVAIVSYRDDIDRMYVLIQLLYLRTSPLLSDKRAIAHLGDALRKELAKLDEPLRQALSGLCKGQVEKEAYDLILKRLWVIIQLSSPMLEDELAALWCAKLLLAFTRLEIVSHRHPERDQRTRMLGERFKEFLEHHEVSAIPIYLLSSLIKLLIRHDVWIGSDVGIPTEVVRAIDCALEYSGEVYFVMAGDGDSSLQNEAWGMLETVGMLTPPPFALSVTEALEWLASDDLGDGIGDFARASMVLSRPAVLVTAAPEGEGEPFVFCRGLHEFASAILDTIVTDSDVFVAIGAGRRRKYVLRDPSPTDGPPFGVQDEMTFSLALGRLIAIYTILSGGKRPPHFWTSFYEGVTSPLVLGAIQNPRHRAVTQALVMDCKPYRAYLRHTGALSTIPSALGMIFMGDLALAPMPHPRFLLSSSASWPGEGAARMAIVLVLFIFYMNSLLSLLPGGM